MNEKEAIEILTYVVTNGMEKDGEDEALDIAVKALNKQIPMKPLGEHYAHMRCPACNHRIPSGGGSSSRRRDNWCNYCGQRIDWGQTWQD